MQLPSATSLSRSLLSLARAGATGVLVVRSERREARFAIARGTPTAISLDPPDEETLGDTLARMGALDRDAHRRALERGPPGTPVGDWLVANGAARRADVQRALVLLSKRRVLLVCRWPTLDVGFMAGAPDVGVSPVPIAAADLVLSAMRAHAAAEPLLVARRRLGDGLLVATRLGRALLASAELTDEELAMRPALESGAPVALLVATAGGSSSAIRSLYALRLLGAAGPPTAGKSYGLLLRKHRQLQRAEGAGSLLDLPPTSTPAEARRALRRLAQRVHPDRYADPDDRVLSRVSGEVMTALVQAEETMRGRG